MIDRRALIVGTAAVAVPAVPAPALPAPTLRYHPDDQYIAKALDGIEDALNRMRRDLAKAAQNGEVGRLGYHCDARCSLTALRMQVDMLTSDWTDQYRAMIARQKR